MRSFWTKIDALEAWHAKLVDKPWLQPLKPTKFLIALILLSTVIAAGMNWYVRHWQYKVWEQNPEIFSLDDGTPLFTTTDAPYFLGLAKAIKDEGNFQAFNEKRVYPLTREKYEQSPPPHSLRDAPLLSVLLSLFSQDSSQKSLLETGNNLIPLTAALTVVMIIFAFGAAGYWMSGAIAAAGGALSFSYLTRSGAGRIDTDQLNLGFFYLMTGLVIFAAKTRSFYTSIALSGLAGAMFWIFDWWYSKPAFGWAFFVGLIWLSFVSSRNIKRVMIQALLFLAASGLAVQGFGISSDSAYLIDNFNYDGLVFPNTFDTITELTKVDFTEILSRISGSVWLGGLSVVGLAFWGLRHPALAIVFGPAAAFALLNFLIGNRAIFYSAPMLWFGFGWALITTAKLVSEKIGRERVKHIAIMFSVFAGFAAVWIASPTSYVQGPTFDKRVVKSFADMGKITTSYKDAVIATWWDYGYMSMFLNQMPTLHDGGAQLTPSTYFVAKSLISSSQFEAAKNLFVLSSSGDKPLIESARNNEDYQANTELQQPEVYLVLTNDMANWIPSISKIGRWNIHEGNLNAIEGADKNYELFYQRIKCSPTSKRGQSLCNEVLFDVQSGKFGEKIVLDGFVVAENGVQTGGKAYEKSNSPFVFQSEIGHKVQQNTIVHRELYKSVFNQLYYLNRADPKYFELVYDDYPVAKIFRVVGTW